MPPNLGPLPRPADPPAAKPELAERVALVRAQLAPIRSRVALLDSYERESLNRLSGGPQTPGSEAHVLDLAYALRWFELGPEGRTSGRTTSRRAGLPTRRPAGAPDEPAGDRIGA